MFLCFDVYNYTRKHHFVKIHMSAHRGQNHFLPFACTFFPDPGHNGEK